MSRPDLFSPRPLRTGGGRRHVVVIGGGASGVLMASHLLRQEADLQVTVLEGRNLLGCGIAYSTSDPDHLLNTRVHNMSAFPDDPHHFQHWLEARLEGRGKTPNTFVSRATYGSYLGDLLTGWQGAGRLACLRHEVLGLDEDASGVTVQLDTGMSLRADLAVLATGHAVAERDPSGLITGAWEKLPPTDPEGRVVIIGSGLSMVDQVLSLVKGGHRGPILVLSRRGQVPRSHQCTTPMAVGRSDVPFGAPVSQLMRFLRQLAREAEAQGGTWRDAVDGIRPHVAKIWQAMSDVERARFLRHAVSWWEVHRHRIPAPSEDRINEALARGQLLRQRATFLRAEEGEDGQLYAVIRPHGGAASERVAAARIIDCRGIRNDPEVNASTLIAGLLARGAARVDPLRIGLEVTGDCRLIDAGGRASARVLAIGPVSRAAFWEITAIPDIRLQVAGLAARIAAEVPAAAP